MFFMQRSLNLSRYCAVLIFLAVLFSCGRGGDSSDPGPETPSETPSENPTENPPESKAHGQAILGPLCGATVHVFVYHDLQTPVHSTTTTESTTLSEAGLFEIPQSILEDDELYVIAVSGGRDIDADDDGVVDESPIQNLGTLHLAATGSRLKAGDFNATILTDIVYHSIYYLLLADYPLETILGAMDSYAYALLKTEVDLDGDKDHDDLLVWDPVLDKAHALHAWSFYQDCIDAVHAGNAYADLLATIRRGVVGTVEIPAGTDDFRRRVVVSGDYAYTTGGSSGLEVVDISDPFNPSLFASAAIPEPRDIVISGHYAYVIGDDLHVIDISDPSNPAVVGTSTYGGDALALSGAYVYSVEGDMLNVTDISVPATPTRVGSALFPADGPLWALRCIAVSGNYAFVTGNGLRQSSTFFAVDISDPSNPVRPPGSSVISLPWNVASITISGHYAYVAAGSLFVLDITDPLHPALAGTSISSGVYGVGLSGDLAYVADYNHGLDAIDISDPAHPTYSFGVKTSWHQLVDVAVASPYAYALSGTGLEVIDISHPDYLVNPAMVGVTAISGGASDSAVSGGDVYAAANTTGLQVVDINDPRDLRLAGAVGLGEESMAHDIALRNNYAYVSSFVPPIYPDLEFTELLFHVIDVDNPDLPVIVSSLALPGTTHDIELVGAYAYVGVQNVGIMVIDTGDPSHPAIVGGIDDSGNSHPMEIKVSGTHAYVANLDLGFQVLDVSDPIHPVLVATLDIPDMMPQSVALSGSSAFVVYDESGLDTYNKVKVIDISDPLHPTVASTLDLPFDPGSVVVSSHYAYVSYSYPKTGMQVVDISDPSNPVFITTVETLRRLTSMEVSGEFFYVTDSYFGLTAYRSIVAP